MGWGCVNVLDKTSYIVDVALKVLGWGGDVLTFLDVLGRTSNIVDANKIFKIAQVNHTNISLQKMQSDTCTEISGADGLER